MAGSANWIIHNLAAERWAALIEVRGIADTALQPQLMIDPYARIERLEDALHRISMRTKEVS